MGRFDHLYVAVDSEVAAPVKVAKKAPAKKKAASKKPSPKSRNSDD
tara:strand:+ start:337 stop:474 length:138 start_codon:yes stop_codon:yes gene_type:complete